METKIEAIIKNMVEDIDPCINIYATGAGLIKGETAFLIRVSPQYLMCVGLRAENTYPQLYRIGGLVEDDVLLNLETAPRSRFAIGDSPLWGTYPFHALIYDLQNP